MCISIIIIGFTVRNLLAHTCFSNCGIINSDSDVEFGSDEALNDYNKCCDSVSTTSGFSLTGISATCTTACKFCYKCIYNHYISPHILAI